MSFRKAAMTAVAAASMIAMPTMASAQAVSASKLSVTSALQGRTGAHVKGEKLSGAGLIVALFAAAAVVGGIVAAANSDDKATSP